MIDYKVFRYEVKAPTRVFWQFTGVCTDPIPDGDMMCCWRVDVTQENNEQGLYFEMYAIGAGVPSLMDVFAAFQSTVMGLLNPIAWEIHKHGNTGMI